MFDANSKTCLWLFLHKIVPKLGDWQENRPLDVICMPGGDPSFNGLHEYDSADGSGSLQLSSRSAGLFTVAEFSAPANLIPE